MSGGAYSLRGIFAATDPVVETTNLWEMGRSGVQVQQPATNVVADVTNFTDQSFHADAVTAVDYSAADGIQGPDVALNESEIQGQQANYMQADAEIKEIVVDAINEVLGPDEGGSFADHIFPDGAPTKFQAAVTMMDPTGVAGSIYSVLNAVAEQADRYGTQETLEILDRVLGQLQESNNPQIQEAMNNTNYFPPKEGYNFDNVTARQLLDFLQRQPEQDPVMQQLQRSLDSIEGIKDNVAYNRENAAEFAEVRYIAGDQSALADMEVAEAETVERYAAYAVEITSDSMRSPGHLEFTEPQFASAPELQVALAELNADAETAPNYNQEAALRRAAEMDMSTTAV